MIIQTAGHDGNIISGEQNILIATSCCQTQGILEIWKYSAMPGSQVSGFDWVLQLSAGCQVVTWGSPVSGWHLILSWHPMSSCPWFVLSPVSSLITDWGLTFTSPLSLLYLDPGQLNMMNCYGSRELNTQDIRAHGSYSSRAGALLTLLSLDLNKLQASLWSCYLGLQMRFGREWGWVRGLVTSNNNHNWNVGAILVHICPK